MQGGARTRTAAYKLVCEDARPTCLSADRSYNAADEPYH
jgi:hypothetical protein